MLHSLTIAGPYNTSTKEASVFRKRPTTRLPELGKDRLRQEGRLLIIWGQLGHIMRPCFKALTKVFGECVTLKTRLGP